MNQHTNLDFIVRKKRERENIAPKIKLLLQWKLERIVIVAKTLKDKTLKDIIYFQNTKK